MNTKSDDQSFSSFMHVLKRRARPAVTAALTVLLGMTVVVFSLPAVYESYATLLIQQSDITPEMLGGAGTKEFVEQRLQQTRDLVMNAENAGALIKKYNLYSDQDDKLSDDDKFALMNESVLIRPQVTGVVDRGPCVAPISLTLSTLLSSMGIRPSHATWQPTLRASSLLPAQPGPRPRPCERAIS